LKGNSSFTDDITEKKQDDRRSGQREKHWEAKIEAGTVLNMTSDKSTKIELSLMRNFGMRESRYKAERRDEISAQFDS
jgi:hypothetical protein